MTSGSITENNHRNDSMEVLYGNETAKAIENFTISDLKMPRAFLCSIGLLKSACAQANAELGLLDSIKSDAIQNAAQEVAKGIHDKQFPVDVFQTGSGTSTNMNANEVIATLATKKINCSPPIHPNDEVNLGQSSNDVIPSCIHIAAAKLIADELIPALMHLIAILEKKESIHQNTIKTGRTHLMDAMPLTFAQEISGWRGQIQFVLGQLQHALESLLKLAIGGTAVGTGVNTHPKFALVVTKLLRSETGLNFVPTENYFHAISAQDTAVNVSGILKTAAVSLSKISDDIRWMSSGPLNGLNEISLGELQKGSSIMPGKVNPVIPEAILMGCTKVIGNDTTITLAGKSGQFQLNTMLPLIAHSLIESIQLVTTCSAALADKVISNLQVKHATLERNLARNPILATALNSLIGYDKSAEIARKALHENRTVLDVAKELTDVDESDLIKALDPQFLVGKTTASP